MPYMWIELHAPRRVQERLHSLYTDATLTRRLPQWLRWWSFHRAMKLRMTLWPQPSWKETVEAAAANAQHNSGRISSQDMQVITQQLDDAIRSASYTLADGEYGHLDPL